MSISTKTGDRGSTELIGGGRVPKDHPRIEALGDLDELGAFLGDARALARGEIAETIRLIQRELISLSGVLANPRGEAPAGWPGAARLEEWIAQREAAASCGGFVLSGDNPLAAKFHIARTVCRRAERRLVTLDWREGVPPPVIRYINRLSDLLFLMAQETLED